MDVGIGKRPRDASATRGRFVFLDESELQETGWEDWQDWQDEKLAGLSGGSPEPTAAAERTPKGSGCLSCQPCQSSHPGLQFRCSICDEAASPRSGLRSALPRAGSQANASKCLLSVNPIYDRGVYLFNFHEQIIDMTRQTVLSFSVAVGILAVEPSQLHAQQPAQRVDGKWSLVIRSVEGPAPRSLELTVEQDSIVTGSVGSPMGSLPIEKGRFVGDHLLIDFVMAGSIGVTYDLRVRGDTLRGFYKQPGYLGDVLGVPGVRDVKFPATAPATRPPR